MLRPLAVVTSLLACLTVPAWSQSPSTTAAPAAPSSGTPVAKKSAPKAKAAAKPVATTDSGLCKYGVIVAVGDVFAVQKIGLTVFGNEYATAGSSGCERYYVFTRLKGQFPGTNQFIEGVGIVNRGVGILNSSFLFANVSLAVFDGDTFEIRKAPSTNFEAVLSALAAGLTSDPGLRKMDDTAFPVTPEEAAKSATLRDGARNFLTEHLDKFLPTYFKE
jgi:hypothetical protein